MNSLFQLITKSDVVLCTVSKCETESEMVCSARHRLLYIHRYQCIEQRIILQLNNLQSLSLSHVSFIYFFY